MQIYIKIGTLPGERMHLCRKRKEPVVGDAIYVKPLPYNQWEREQRVVIDEIRSIAGETLFIGYRM